MDTPVPAGVSCEASLEGDRLWLRAGETFDAVVDPEGNYYCDSTGLGLCYEREDDGTASVVNVDFTGTGTGKLSANAMRGREGFGDWLSWNALRPGGEANVSVANCLDAEEVTIWKDVDGLLNADPKRFANTVQLPHIPYSEAIELAFYGATISHPKTIKPLQNKGITLKVQSFLHPDHEPSLIDGGHRKNDESIPSFIVKDNQTLVSISPRDYSFMDERNLKTIFEVCADLNIHANMIQTSALMLSFCFDSNEQKLKQLRANLKDGFSVKYNDGLQLFTIRHYQDGLESDFIKGKKVLVKQGSRSTMQFVLSDPDHRP
jgi:aspartate kinase